MKRKEHGKLQTEFTLTCEKTTPDEPIGPTPASTTSILAGIRRARSVVIPTSFAKKRKTDIVEPVPSEGYTDNVGPK